MVTQPSWRRITDGHKKRATDSGTASVFIGVISLTLSVVNMNPLIVNVRHAKGGFVYVGRAMYARGLAESPYANPFPITKTETRRKVLLDYIEHFITQVSSATFDRPCG